MTEAKKIFESYGKALKHARKDHSMKQGSLAERMGINQSEISRWENSDAVPLDHNQEKIKQVLNIDIAPVKGGWCIIDSQKSHSVNEPAKAYADEVDLPEDGQLSRGQMKELLSQIESIVRILKDSL